MKSGIFTLFASANAACTGDETFDTAVATCSPTEFKLEINACAFENNRFTDPLSAFMNGPEFGSLPTIDVNATNQCVPTLDGDNYVFVISDDIEECGTAVTNNGTHVTYENAVQSTVGQENAVISRKRMMKVNFSCTFDLEMTLSLADAIMPKIQHFEVDVGTAEGAFSVSMGLYTDDQFTDVIEGEFEIVVPEKLHVGVNIDDDSAMIMQLKKCWATPSSDSEDPVSYPFIDNFCGDPDELNVYESLIIHSNGQSKNGQYSIEAFSFNGNENGEIYLHCTARICDPGNEDCSLDSVCAGRRKRRTAIDAEGGEFVTSIGPVSVAYNNQG